MPRSNVDCCFQRDVDTWIQVNVRALPLLLYTILFPVQNQLQLWVENKLIIAVLIIHWGLFVIPNERLENYSTRGMGIIYNTLKYG